MPIVIPPLRDRAEDIPILAYRFATRAAAEIKKEITGISQEALALLAPIPGRATSVSCSTPWSAR